MMCSSSWRRTPQGLSTEEVAKRLERYGPNELKEKPRPTFLQLVLAQLNNFIVILLIVASVISAAAGRLDRSRR